MEEIFEYFEASYRSAVLPLDHPLSFAEFEARTGVRRMWLDLRLVLYWSLQGGTKSE